MYKRINGEPFELWIGSNNKSVIVREKKRVKFVLPGKQSRVRQITVSHTKGYGTEVRTTCRHKNLQ